MIVFDKVYTDESLYDLPEDIGNALGQDLTLEIPTDEYGFRIGTFHITVTWNKDE